MVTFDHLLDDLLGGVARLREPAPYALLSVRGPDAEDFLQRLCSQDVAALAPGGLAPAAFLDGKGKLVATCLVARDPRAEEAYVLETQQAQVAALEALLERYHFTEQLTLGRLPTSCRERIGAAGADGRGAATVEGEALVLAHARRGLQFERWHAEDLSGLPAAAGELLDDERAEGLRMAAGLVRVGVESEPNTLALEADLDDHCSLTKGCYTGQEVVARIHTYGHTNRGLCLLRIDAGEPITAPVTLLECDDEVPVGRVMAAVPLPQGTGRIGLGYLPTDFQAIGTRLVLEGGGDAIVVGPPPTGAP
ncbi:MAG: hypothetical protein VYE77_00435 [Planctomycetota bacterium]|nr:hypothetical protein [Planctomycetota bacterium]